MSGIQVQHNLTLLSRDIVRTLLYYDIFNYPLKKEEIHRCSRIEGVSLNKVAKELTQLCQRGQLVQMGDFYASRKDEGMVERRIEGNKRAEKSGRIARWVSRFIAGFPFVRAVLLSGSISKGFMASDSDLDFFIITQPGRLWVARTLLVFFKKVFLFDSHKYFCVNYFVDTKHLEIEEKNIFTATELVYLVPTYGAGLYETFLEKNSWSRAFFPNFPRRPLNGVRRSGKGPLKALAEFVLRGSWGEKLDAYFMRLTIERWNEKFSDMQEREFDVALKSRPYVSKHHPNHFQKRVLSALDERIKAFESKFGVSLEPDNGKAGAPGAS